MWQLDDFHPSGFEKVNISVPPSVALGKQRVTDLQQIVGIVSDASALEMNRKQFLFVGPHSASS